MSRVRWSLAQQFVRRQRDRHRPCVERRRVVAQVAPGLDVGAVFVQLEGDDLDRGREVGFLPASLLVRRDPIAQLDSESNDPG